MEWLIAKIAILLVSALATLIPPPTTDDPCPKPEPIRPPIEEIILP